MMKRVGLDVTKEAVKVGLVEEVKEAMRGPQGGVE